MASGGGSPLTGFRPAGTNTIGFLSAPDRASWSPGWAPNPALNLDAFENQLLRSTIPAIWDEAGDGRWDERDPSTGNVRWQTETGHTPSIYPTDEAIIRSNAVTVPDDFRIRSATIESGSLTVPKTATLNATSKIDVESNGALTVDGKLEANRLTIDDEGRFALNGSARLDAIQLREGRAQIFPTADLQADNVTQSGGELIIAGDFSVGRIYISGGSVELHDHGPHDVRNLFRFRGQSKLRIVISDESWDSTFNLAQGVTPQLSGELVLDFAAAANPKQLVGQTLDLFDWSEDVEPSGEFNRVSFPARVEADTSRLYSDGEIVIRSVLATPAHAGDFNGDDVLDASDIDALAERIRVQSTDHYFDVNGDNEVTQRDHTAWVEDLKQTYYGDSNLDGEFNSGDLVEVFAAGKYEDDLNNNSGWADGDWNADAEFDSSDLVVAFADGGYEQGPRVNAVPEPSAAVLIVFGMLALVRRRK